MVVGGRRRICNAPVADVFLFVFSSSSSSLGHSLQLVSCAIRLVNLCWRKLFGQNPVALIEMPDLPPSVLVLLSLAGLDAQFRTLQTKRSYDIVSHPPRGTAFNNLRSNSTYLVVFLDPRNPTFARPRLTPGGARRTAKCSGGSCSIVLPPMAGNRSRHHPSQSISWCISVNPTESSSCPQSRTIQLQNDSIARD